MSAETEILGLINQYSFALDTADFEAFDRLFEHADWIAEGQKLGDDALANIKIYDDGTPKTRHVTSNVVLEIQGSEGKAKGQCYVTVFQQTDEFPLQPIFSGHYFDEFERVDGRWRFSRREIRHSLVGDLNAHLKSPGETIPGA
jgi:hypothetical protein